MCAHKDFRADVTIARLEDTGQFVAEIKVECAECREPFQFLGLQPGLDTHGAAVSLDGLEARLAVSPKSATPSPGQRMAFGVRKFDG